MMQPQQYQQASDDRPGLAPYSLDIHVIAILFWRDVVWDSSMNSYTTGYQVYENGEACLEPQYGDIREHAQT